MNKTLKQYCKWPNNHITIHYNGNVKLCCIRPYEFDTSFFDYNKRKNIIESEPDDICKNCLRGNSGETQFTKSYFTEDNDITSITIILPPICNLKCVMCGPEYSSSWISDYNKLNNVSYKHSTSFTDYILYVEQLITKQILTKSVKKIKIVGGEPMMYETEKFLMLLDLFYLINPDVKLIIVTNGTVYKDEIINKLKQFPNAAINVSIDGIDKVNNYIRYPADWSVVRDNFIRFKKYIKTDILHSVSILNFLEYENIKTFAEDTNSELYSNIVEYPKYLSIKVLSPSIKTLNSNSELNNFIKEDHEYMHGETLDYIKKIDYIRNLNILDYIPSFEKIIKTWNANSAN